MTGHSPTTNSTSIIAGKIQIFSSETNPTTFAEIFPFSLTVSKFLDSSRFPDSPEKVTTLASTSWRRDPLHNRAAQHGSYELPDATSTPDDLVDGAAEAVAEAGLRLASSSPRSWMLCFSRNSASSRPFDSICCFSDSSTLPSYTDSHHSEIYDQ